jgi:hypothetical protein
MSFPTLRAAEEALGDFGHVISDDEVALERQRREDGQREQRNAAVEEARRNEQARLQRDATAVQQAITRLENSRKL